jgi:hypothetical protein
MWPILKEKSNYSDFLHIRMLRHPNQPGYLEFYCTCQLQELRHPLIRGETIKVKESRNRPGKAQRVLEGLGSQIFMTYGT